jgi:S-adenosylmethionine uptake transporter
MYWQPMSGGDWIWMGVLCLTAALGHYLMIRALEVAEASAIQPFAYLQLVFIAILGVTVFGETLRPNVIAGAVIVVGAGLFTLWRARIRAS